MSASPKLFFGAGHWQAAASRACLGGFFIVCGFNSMAAELHESFGVSAVVQPVVKFQINSSPAAVLLGASDIERGFVDVSEPVEVHVDGNSADAYALEIAPTSVLFSSVTVHGIGADVLLGPEGGTIVQRGQYSRVHPLRLTFRFALRSGLTPGRYPWPLHISARPLEPQLQ